MSSPKSIYIDRIDEDGNGDSYYGFIGAEFQLPDGLGKPPLRRVLKNRNGINREREYVDTTRTHLLTIISKKWNSLTVPIMNRMMLKFRNKCSHILMMKITNSIYWAR